MPLLYSTSKITAMYFSGSVTLIELALVFNEIPKSVGYKTAAFLQQTGRITFSEPSRRQTAINCFSGCFKPKATGDIVSVIDGMPKGKNGTDCEMYCRIFSL